MPGKQKRRAGRAEADQEVREPIVDIFEADDYLLVQAELPGIGKKDVRIEYQGDVLTISAQRGDRKYRKEVLLPRDLSQEKMRISCKNGILEIKCFK
jgi:HSP20 family protein